MCICILFRGDFAPLGSSEEAEMGADVEVDCREGTNEHAVHLAGRPGNTNTSSNQRHVNTHPAIKVCNWILWNYKIIWTMCRSPQDFLFLSGPKILTVKCCCWVKFWSRVGMLQPNKLVRPQYIQVKLYEGISIWRSGKTCHDSLQLAKLHHHCYFELIAKTLITIKLQ